MMSAKRRMLSLARSKLGGDAAKTVKYTPCSRQDLHADEELEDIAIVSSNADPGQVKYGSGPIAANGPRVIPACEHLMKAVSRESSRRRAEWWVRD